MTLHSIIILLFCGVASADEYRYVNRLLPMPGHQPQSGPHEQIIDSKDKEITIVFSKNSNTEALFMLKKLFALHNITGTKDKIAWRGVQFEQAIILHGTLKDEIHRTAYAETYREFVLERMTIKFPLVLQRYGRMFDVSHIETHFTYHSLFPTGLNFKNKKIDFSQYTVSTIKAANKTQ